MAKMQYYHTIVMTTLFRNLTPLPHLTPQTLSHLLLVNLITITTIQVTSRNLIPLIPHNNPQRPLKYNITLLAHH